MTEMSERNKALWDRITSQHVIAHRDFAPVAAAAPFLQGVKVNELGWVAHKGDQHCKIAWTCEGIGGWYAIEHRHEGHFDMWTPNNPDGGRFITLEAAKAAAQADFEARILSALEPSAARSLALEEGFRKGLEAACEVIDAHSEYDRRMCCDGHECGCYGAIVHQSMQHYIRALSSTDHADAGKVEGDGNRWRIFEAACARGYWGIELEQASNDDEPILYPIKVHRDILVRIVEAHNTALPSAPSQEVAG